MGISSISRILHVSKSSVQRIIIKFSILKPLISERNQVYEIDELRNLKVIRKMKAGLYMQLIKQMEMS